MLIPAAKSLNAPAGQNPGVAIVIVNYNGGEIFAPCVAAALYRRADVLYQRWRESLLFPDAGR